MLYFISASALGWPLQHALVERSAEHSDMELQRTRASSLHDASSFAFYTGFTDIGIPRFPNPHTFSHAAWPAKVLSQASDMPHLSARLARWGSGWTPGAMPESSHERA